MAQSEAVADDLDVARRAAAGSGYDEETRRLVHELRSPLTSIVGFSRLLANSSAQLSQDQQTLFLHRISSESERLHALLDQFIEATVGHDRLAG